MKKIYLELDKDLKEYELVDNLAVNEEALGQVSMVLERFDYDWIQCDIDREDDEVFIYSLDSIKKQADIEFKTQEEQDLFDKRYEEYYDKRWDEMPQVTMSLTNWEELEKKWEIIEKEKPQYVVFTLDNFGLLDIVDVYGKDELTEEDRAYIKKDQEKFLKWKKAYNKYLLNHPDYSDVWRGPQDDEYEADIMKYYDQSGKDS